MKKNWLFFAIAVTVMWGLWGALTALMVQDEIPSTLVYSIWAMTMIIPCIVALKQVGWRLQTNAKSIWQGGLIGFLGSGGQMLLFHSVNIGPSYLIFPIVSLSPLITIGLSVLLLKERTTVIGTIGIVIALIALPLFEYSGTGKASDTSSISWFIFALLVMAAWGLQAYMMKLSNSQMNAESIFFYMTVTALMLVPVALAMTEFSALPSIPFTQYLMIGGVQILNAIGALCLVYAFRYGKAIVVSPLTNAGSPLLSSVIIITVLGVLPSTAKIAGIVLALIAAVLLSLEPDQDLSQQEGDKC